MLSAMMRWFAVWFIVVLFPFCAFVGGRRRSYYLHLPMAVIRGSLRRV